MNYKEQVVSTVFRTSWSFSRWIRLGIGLAIAYSAYRDENGLVAGFAFFLMLQALTNTGCAGNQCSIPRSNQAESTKELKADKPN
tara:strand:- start:1576 stop:1830 length:255 start_codon:yes stop_codon:yes gene_type:complete